MTESELTSRDVTIQVTEEDIKKGIQGDGWQCPVALAMNRHLRVGTYTAYVGESYVTFRHASLERPLPQVARDFIRHFDECGAWKAHPFSFSLELPEWILKTEDQDRNVEVKA